MRSHRPRRLHRAPALAALVALGAWPASAQERTEGAAGAYVEEIEGTLVTLDMLPVGGGDVQPDAPRLWMSRTEVTWDLYDVFLYGLDAPAGVPEGADAVSRPSKPYVLPGESFGHEGHPAVGVTSRAARAFAAWLSRKTGRAYRLPTEEEWERACRQGSVPPAGAPRSPSPQDPERHARRAWHRPNAEGRTHPVGGLEADALGLHDLLGNAAEWVVGAEGEPVVKGGSYRSATADLTCAARDAPTPAWNATDPQLPKSSWWLSDAPFVGFRVVMEETMERPSARQVVLVTGSTDGLGREVARRLASAGHHVIVHGRNRERGEALVREIAEKGKGSAVFYAADFASLEEVRELARRVLRDHDRLDALVNNAGIWLNRPGRELSGDGHELHFQVNYLAGFLLARMLLPRLRESAPSRIVNVSSAAQAPVDFDDVMLERGYSGGRAYAQSKLAQVMLTFDLARELEGTGVSVYALHPATLMDTHMVIEAGVRPRATVAEGAEAVLRLVTSEGLESGGYFDGTDAARAHAQAYDEAARERLRNLSEELVGIRR